MKSRIVSVIAGYVIWTVLWLGGNALLFSTAAQRAAAGETVTDAATLLPILLWSIVCSLAAGFALWQNALFSCQEMCREKPV